MADSVVNILEVLPFCWSKISGLLKRLVDLRSLITSLATSLFELLELFVELYSK